MRVETITFPVAPGVSLQADRYGAPDGAPVILLHGGGQTRWSWKGTAQALADAGGKGGFAVHAVDMRGHGQSSWCPDGQYGLGHFAQDVRVLAGMMPAPPVIVGASLGGLSALLACGEDPQAPCAGLVLVDIAPRMEQRGTSRVGAFMRDTLDGFDTLEEAAAAVADYARNGRRDTRPEGLLKNLRQDADGRYRWHWDPAFMAAGKSGWDPDVVERRLMAAAARITAPMLIVRGGESDVLSRETMDHLKQALPHIAQAEIAGARHMIAGDDNARFNAAILPFLQAHAAAQGGAA
ncbi:alpha/beta hydrolase [Caenibius sp. WL]|uniref:alpha/beta fold hydrolase n=1 Tax=Caenibius sp. WL TaxID=2872646 RepID=UPI001C99E633|nr:alpha/beta hydrolase [Caenibius sp. WL]QZP09176.1 alpha/beta hydrolase [Caenibius sp. WL]